MHAHMQPWPVATELHSAHPAPEGGSAPGRGSLEGWKMFSGSSQVGRG